MNQIELIDYYCKRLQFPAEQAVKVKKYLLAECEDTESISFCAQYIPYDITNVLIEHFNTDCGDTAKRAYRLLGKIAEDRLISSNYYSQGSVYKTYHEAGMSEDFIRKSITKSIQVNDNFINIIKRLNKEMETKKDLTALSEAFLYYIDFIEREVKESSHKKETLYTFMLKFLLRVWHKQDEEKFKLYDVLLTHTIFSALNVLYGEKGYKEAEKNALFSTVSSNLYKSAPPIIFEIPEDKLAQFVCCVSCLLKDESALINDAYKLCMQVEEPNKLYLWMNESIETLLVLLSSLGISMEKQCAMAVSGIFLEGFIQKGIINTAKLIEYYRADRDAFMKSYIDYKNALSPEALLMHAVLCREENTPVLVKEAEELFTSYYLQCRNNNEFAFLPKKNAEDTFLSLKGFVSTEETEISCRFGTTMKNALICTGALYEYSQFARYAAAAFMKVMISNNCGKDAINYILTAGNAFYKDFNNTEMFKKLAEISGAKRICMVYASNSTEIYYNDFIRFAKNHLEVVKEVFEEINGKQDNTVETAVKLFYKEDIGLSYEELAKLLEHRLKTVSDFIEAFIKDKEDKVRVYVEKIEKGKSKNGKEAAVRLIKLWDADKISEELSAITKTDELISYIKRKYSAGNNNKIPYKEQLEAAKVRIKGSDEVADIILLEYYISEYMLLKEVSKINVCEKIREFLDASDLRKLLCEMYLQWLRDGADTKIKNLLIPYAISAGVSEISEFKKQIDTFTECSRGALAAFMVSALGTSGSDFALLIIDGIANKYKNKQVKAAAEKALMDSAAMLSITKEELLDKIIPTLSFSKNREREFDFGSRKFKGVLSDKLEVLLYDETGKQIKSLPKPSSKDDNELAEASSSEYKDLKKQLKIVVTNQKMRLEDAIITGRRWTKEKWEHLFIENPIMNGFAAGLIWEEVDSENNIMGTFRYMSDGSFNSPDEEEYILTAGTYIVLLHPIDADEELLNKWKTQLEDYEIIQPIRQLSMPVYTFTEEELLEKAIKRYTGKKVYFGTIRGLMDKYDWKRTSIIDGGGYVGYYYEDAASSIGVQISFDFLYVGMDSAETVTIEAMEYYKKDSIVYASYTYDDINDNNRVLPKDVPVKLASFTLMVGELLAEKSIK